VADGRSPLSVGMTYREMADSFRHIGAFHALNLDGGGSTAMAVRDPNSGIVRVLNTPSDGQERYVPDGLGIFYTDLPAVAAEAQ
jgi:exopolysaccharide biosynthesis protein